ncbi:MAG: zinc ribbon domain-containing protein [Polyangiales bacterium]
MNETREASETTEATEPTGPRADDGGAAFAARWMPLGLAVAFVGAAALAGARYGLAVTLLALAAGALLLVITLGYRTLTLAFDDEHPSEASVVSVAVVSPAEERKERALKAIADLDHERAIGNVTAEDFENLRGRYRQEAKAAMRAVDDEHKERRAAAEAYLAKVRGVKAGKAGKPAKVSSVAEATKAPAKAPTNATRERCDCPACHKPNDEDARFCKHCGRTLTEESG